MLLLAGSHHNLYLKNIRIVEIILELLLAPDCPPPLPPLIISRLVWLIEQLGEHGRGQRGACDLNIRGVGPSPSNTGPGVVTGHGVTLPPECPSRTLQHDTFHFKSHLDLLLECLEFKDLFLENYQKRVIFIGALWLLVLVPDPI